MSFSWQDFFSPRFCISLDVWFSAVHLIENKNFHRTYNDLWIKYYINYTNNYSYKICNYLSSCS